MPGEHWAFSLLFGKVIPKMSDKHDKDTYIMLLILNLFGKKVLQIRY